MAAQVSLTASAQADLVISEAFDRFKATVTPDDQKLLEDTTVDDVVKAMVDIQQDLRNRRDNRNLRKLYPFLQGLGNYGQAIEILSNGCSPFLPWAWAPVRLMLQVWYLFNNSSPALIFPGFLITFQIIIFANTG